MKIKIVLAHFVAIKQENGPFKGTIIGQAVMIWRVILCMAIPVRHAQEKAKVSFQTYVKKTPALQYHLGKNLTKDWLKEL